MSSSECTTTDDKCRDGEQASWVQGSSSGAIFIGCIVGQLVMGYIGDILGRNRGLICTVSIALLGSVLSAFTSQGDAESVYATVIVCRFILGVGAGGVFPIAAAKASEDGGSSGVISPVSCAWAYSFQMPGMVAPWLVTYVLSYSSLGIEWKWRLLLGLGSVPCAIVIMGIMLEDRMFSKSIEYGSQDSTTLKSLLPDIDPRMDQMGRKSSIRQNSESTNSLISVTLHQPSTIYKLIGCGGSWFLYGKNIYIICSFVILCPLAEGSLSVNKNVLYYLHSRPCA
jgi:PHS family inorganic phosphate transporter-like MFS transporter